MGQLGQLIVRCTLLATAGACGALLATPPAARAQAALAATASVSPDDLPPDSRLTLRPTHGLENLAAKIARVLTLRGDTAIEIGPAPPPGLLEAVSAGNVALARDGTVIHLVMGAAMGESIEAHVELPSDGRADVRTLALAIEALRDRAIEARARQEPPDAQSTELEPPLPPPEWVAPEPLPDVAPLPAPQPSTPPAPHGERAGEVLSKPQRPSARDDSELLPRLDPSERGLKVKPLLYLSLYGGASTESSTLRSGIGTGGGLCVQGQCLLLAIEYPLPISLEAGSNDVRYRYPTFSCSFYSHIMQLGAFKPAVSLGILTRMGHFERDLGIKDYRPGLDTDLGLRGTLQGTYPLFEAVEAVAEGGIDYALDRWQFGHGDSLAFRGPRVAPWVQAGIRVRPE